MEECKTIGSCKRCGVCCSVAEIWLDPTMDDKNAEFAMKRTGAHMMWRTQDGKLKLLLGVCPHLSYDGMKCTIYDVRPQICREYPPDQNVKGGCRYYDDTTPEYEGTE